MTPTEIIHRGLGAPKYEGGAEVSGLCCVCGATGTLAADKNIIKMGFTDWDYLSQPYTAVCEPCAVCLTEPKLRRSSFLANPEQVLWLGREDIWDVLFHDKPPLTPPFVMYVTTSWKKHGSIKTRTNNNWESFCVQFEELGVVVEPASLTKLSKALGVFYSVPPEHAHKKQPSTYFTKDQIRTGIYPVHRIQETGLDTFFQNERIIQNYRRTPVFGLLLWALNRG